MIHTSDANQCVAVAVRRSRIDGFGVFAAETITAGTKIGALTEQLKGFDMKKALEHAAKK